MLSVVTLNVVMLSVIMMSVNMLIVFMLNVVVPIFAGKARGLYYKHFGFVRYECTFRNVPNNLKYMPSKHFLPYLIFASKAEAYPTEAPFRCSTLE
jgi:hypothetical protein